jgi:rubrerythrin
MLMAGFMSHTQNKQTLFDFSDILFRLFTWSEHEMIQYGECYDYDRDAIPIKVERLGDMLKAITSRLLEIDLQLLGMENKALASRIATDITYMTDVLKEMNDEVITAFNMERQMPNTTLTDEARDALPLFLFDESYKEYERIMIYNYLKAHSEDAYLNRIFQILIDESFYHLKCFGDMMAKMGILAVPRIIMKELYQVEDVIQFLKDGIEEELAAKEECKRLSDAVGKDSEMLSKFFDFINHQENYHISLMKDALAYYAKEKHG